MFNKTRANNTVNDEIFNNYSLSCGKDKGIHYK